MDQSTYELTYCSQLDELGKEILNPIPIIEECPFQRQETMEQRMMRMIRQELSDKAAVHDFETEEEAEDFDIPGEDDSFPFTPHEFSALKASQKLFLEEEPSRVPEPPSRSSEAPTEPKEDPSIPNPKEDD